MDWLGFSLLIVGVLVQVFTRLRRTAFAILAVACGCWATYALEHKMTALWVMNSTLGGCYLIGCFRKRKAVKR